jgi:hypothetical protein
MVKHYTYIMTRKNTPNGGFAGSIGSAVIEDGGELRIRVITLCFIIANTMESTS